MPNGSYTLAEYPAEQLDVACDACGRRAKVSKARLVAAYGPEIALPDLRKHLAAEAGCTRYGNMRAPCGLHFPDLPDLMTRGGAEKPATS